MGYRLWLIGFLLTAIAMTASAVPAYRGPIVRTLEDGTQKVIYMHGDEYFHYITDAEGQWLHEKTLLPMTAEQRRKAESGKRKANARRVQAQTEGIGDQPNPAPRGLLLLVQFKDVKFTTPKDTLDSLLNGTDFKRDYKFDYSYDGKTYHFHIQSEGSARQYFYDQSYGAYSPQFDVFGPVTLSRNAEYYGQDEIDEEDGSTRHDVNIKEFVKEACELADEAGADFSQYDNDGDGKVDFVYFIYAGFGQADGGGESTIWPHQWDVSYYKYKHDGKRIGRYACGCELNFISKVYDGIGTFCHEFSHVLGIPDLYETSYDRQGVHTLFQWDIMDQGSYNNDSNTPPAYSAYERFYMGWLTPRILVNPEVVTLPSINDGQGQSLLISSTDSHNLSGWDPNPTEYYLLETRKKEGWDLHLPGEGLLITKIRYDKDIWKSNTVNNDADAMGVDILEAMYNSTSKAKDTDAYPVGRLITSWTGCEGHEVTNIQRQADGSIYFLYRGGTEDVERVQSSEVSIQKVIRDGQIIIIRGDKEYTILGHENHQL